MKSDSQAGAGAPAQSNESVGHPQQKATTGEAQTGTGAQQNQNNQGQLNSKQVPGQSKDALGHPEERKATGQGQTGQEPGQTSQTVPGKPAKESTN